MNWVSIVVLAGFSLLPVRISNAKPAGETEIPLGKIYALEMPGTINLWKVDDKAAWKQVVAIQCAIAEPDAKGKGAKSAFVVPGVGLKALQEAKRVLVEGAKPNERIPQGSEVSIVFFSHRFGRYVHLESVSRTENQITIRFKFVPHVTKEITTHFALIPLGHCSPGRTKVEITQMPMDKSFVDDGFKPTSEEVRQKIVCQSFAFECEREGKSTNMP